MGLAVEVDELRKEFKGGVRALDGVSFGVEEGTVFGLLGPNGAGKTTAVRILTTILKPDSGSARVLDYDVVADPRAVRASIGLAGQYAAVDENLTGKENLRLIGQLTHLRRSVATGRAGELLEQFDLADAGGRQVKTYSGGMRRRLDLAAALMDRPRVLFLDEPTTGLDPQSRIALWGVIDELIGGGTTVLLTTQYLEEADRLAKRLVVVDHGQVIAEGTSAELKATLGASVLDLEMGDVARAEQSLAVLRSRLEHAPAVRGSIVEIPLDEGPRRAMDVLRVLDELDLIPNSFAVREPSLDDVFLALTGHAASDGTAPEGDSREPSEDKVPGRGRRGRRGRRRGQRSQRQGGSSDGQSPSGAELTGAGRRHSR
ncbi:MAG: ATP-binding cassette domain-containing protein [Acidimicrobiales bacterium]